MEKKLKIIKRSGEEVLFDVKKIEHAISGANNEVVIDERLTEEQIKEIGRNIEKLANESLFTYTVEDIQDLVETQIMKYDAYNVAKRYIRYRYEHELMRKSNTTDNQILSLIETENEEIKQENSNKNPTICSVQRDYMAGEVSKDITRRFLLADDIIKAHDEGIIHFHDMDYFASHIHNCDLVNLKDMLMNGTVISETMIDRPHSFSTACNIATQIIAQVASSQYGGQSISLSHLVPFVDISRKKIYNDTLEELKLANGDLSKLDEIVKVRLRREIEKGIQTIQYQVVTLMTTNGLYGAVGRYKIA